MHSLAISWVRSLIYRPILFLVPNPHQILQLTLANSLDWTVVHMRQMFTASSTAAYLPQPGGDTTPSNNAYFDFCQHANIVNTLCTYVTVNTSNINPLSVICLQPDMHRLQDSQIPFIAQACQGWSMFWRVSSVTRLYIKKEPFYHSSHRSTNQAAMKPKSSWPWHSDAMSRRLPGVIWLSCKESTCSSNRAYDTGVH